LLNIEKLIITSKNFLNYRFIFLTDSIGSVSCRMKCIIPSRSLNLYGIESHVVVKDDIDDYLKLSRENDVVIISKVHPWLCNSTLETIAKIKSNVSYVFCEASEEGSFHSFYSNDVACESPLSILSGLIDGFIYETRNLKDLIQQKVKGANTFLARHVHSNCHNFFNSASPIGSNEKIEIYKKDIHENLSQACKQIFKNKNFARTGYIGRPKYCHDYLALNVCNYELSHRLGRCLEFISCNPGPHDNVQKTLLIDFGYSLMKKELSISKNYFDYKTGNKVTALWSLGIPGLFSPLASYKKIFSDNDIDFEFWSIPEYKRHDCPISNSRSLGTAMCEKIEKIITDKDYEQRRIELFNISSRYNPVNIFWLYEDIFNYILKQERE